MPEAEEPPVDPALAAEVRAITLGVKRALVEALPPHLRETKMAMTQAARAQAARRKEAKAEKRRLALELLLTGYTRAEIARTIQQDERAVSRALKPVFPFPHPGRDHRYIMVALSAPVLANLDRLAADMLLSRSRALEAVARAALEEDAIVARRTLRIVRREAC